MLSALIPAELSYPAMPLEGQQAHHRLVRSGPLVLGAAPFKFPSPTLDRDRTVSRRSEPSSRTALIGEQPNPWDFRPRMRRADIEVPNGAVDMNSWAPSACYPRGSFYPLSDNPSTRSYQITKPCFRTCSTCRSRSQALLCLCTLWLISIQPERTFGRLRYSLGGDRPSQTTRLTLFPGRITARG
jgi:hypothetical protein